MQYVPVPSPTSSRFIDGNAPCPGYGVGGNIAGVTAYMFWNQTVYAELGGHGTSRGLASFMSAGLSNADTTKLRGTNPCLRLALRHAWGPHNLMLGTSGMSALVNDDPLNTSDPSNTSRFTDFAFDAQYQYLLDPHTVTAQFVYANSKQRHPPSRADQAVAFVDAAGNALANTNAADTSHLIRAKLSYNYIWSNTAAAWACSI
jgi:hypothetical protein